MTVSHQEMQEDPGKVRMRKNLYFWGGLGMLVLGVVLVGTYFTRDEWPALAMAAVGFFWCSVLLFHARKTRELERMMESRALHGQGPGDDLPGDAADACVRGATGAREEAEREK